MDLREFKSRLELLLGDYNSNPQNLASHKLIDCSRCFHCVFCRNCDRCYKCSYCSDCSESSHLVHCHTCRGCHHSANCYECTTCSNSAYLVMCSDCSESNYCFGCVGLVRKDFHILNEPYGRAEYFEIVGRLKAELGIRS